MAKRKKESTDWVITKGQLARWQKEQQRRRQIIIVVSIVIAIVVALLVYAIVDTVKGENPVVLSVTGPQGERSFHMDYYTDMLRLYGIGDASPAEQGTRARSILSVMENDEIYRQLAIEQGISVAAEEVNEKITRDLSEVLDTGTPSPTNPATLSYSELMARYTPYLDRIGVSVEQYRNAVRSEVRQVKVQEHIKNQQVPEEVEQAHLEGIKIDTASPEDSGSPSTEAPVETATPAGTEQTTRDPQAIYAEIKQRLANGEDFGALAAEYGSAGSTGELGWYPREIVETFYGEPMAEAAFSNELNALSEPIPVTDTPENTQYWIIRVVERTTHPLEESHQQFMAANAFNEWFETQLQRFTTERKLDNEGIREAIRKALS